MKYKDSKNCKDLSIYILEEKDEKDGKRPDRPDKADTKPETA